MDWKDKKVWIFGGLLIAVIALGVYFHFQNKIPALPGKEGNSVSITPGSNNYTVSQNAVEGQGLTLPDLDREVHFGAHITQSQQADLMSKIDTVRAHLKTDETRGDDWFTLAVLYHGANDFDAARDVWEFLLKVIDAPQSAVLYDNLGKLYKFDLKDFPKSEMYFRESMKANPNSLSPYTELFELYRYLYKTETTAAADILNAAAEKFPKETDPYVLLGEYYRDKKQYDDARAAFTKAITRAQSVGNLDLVTAIRKEMDSLPK